MFDAQLRPLIDRLLDPIGQGLVRLGVTANQVTMIGAAFGLIAVGCAAAGLFYPALWFVIANRVIDGLDGAVARQRERERRWEKPLDLDAGDDDDFAIFEFGDGTPDTTPTKVQNRLAKVVDMATTGG